MQACQIRAFDAPPMIVQIDTPAPGPGQVLVEIAACGLNFADLLMAKGQYQERAAPPFTLGMEAAGTVAALGPGVAGPPVGSRVAVFAGTGALAEAGVFDAAAIVPIPDAMPFTDAAAFQVAYGTSHLGLAHRARLAAGETLLVLGAAGGVGLTAVEIGKLMGARVIAAARGPEKARVARAAGADVTIDTETEDLKAVVKSLGGADVVYDPVGGAQFRAAMSATNPGGRVLVVGFASGEVPEIRANHLLVKNVDVLGYWWGGYARFAPALMAESLATLLGWYEAGRLRPHVSHVLPLARAAEGLELIRSRRSTGKVVIDVQAAE